MIKPDMMAELLGVQGAASVGLTAAMLWMHLVDDHGMDEEAAAQRLGTTRDELRKMAQLLKEAVE